MANHSRRLSLLISLISLLLCQINWAVASQYSCSSSELDKLDQISARILSLNEHQRHFPEKVSQIPRYCRETKEDLNLVASQNGKCLQGDAKRFASVIVYSVRRSMKSYCNMRKKRRIHQSLLVGRCMNRNAARSNACLATYIDILQRARRAEPPELRIGHACCHYFQLVSCIETVVQGIVDVSCGEWIEQSDTCESLPEPPPKQRDDQTVRTFALPLIELWNSL